jgi:hypothetical protein
LSFALFFLVGITTKVTLPMTPNEELQIEVAKNVYEYGKWIEELKRMDAHRAHDTETEFGNKNSEAAINSANAVIKTALLINGGSAVAMLASIGGLVSQKVVPVSELPKIADGLMWFTSGVALAAVTALLAYFTNLRIRESSVKKLRFYEHPFVKDSRASTIWRRCGVGFQVAAVLFGLLSLSAFIAGTINVHNSIVGLKTTENPLTHLVRPN